MASNVNIQWSWMARPNNIANIHPQVQIPSPSRRLSTRLLRPPLPADTRPVSGPDRGPGPPDPDCGPDRDCPDPDSGPHPEPGGLALIVMMINYCSWNIHSQPNIFHHSSGSHIGWFGSPSYTYTL